MAYSLTVKMDVVGPSEMSGNHTIGHHIPVPTKRSSAFTMVGLWYSDKMMVGWKMQNVENPQLELFNFNLTLNKLLFFLLSSSECLPSPCQSGSLRWTSSCIRSQPPAALGSTAPELCTALEISSLDKTGCSGTLPGLEVQTCAEGRDCLLTYNMAAC